MKERLLADWLDKINERGYQATFCLHLIATGFRIIHNTRHSPVEFGKDVVAVGPDGVLYAFQLKGDPGGRLTSNGWRNLLPQLLTLVSHPWPASELSTATAYQPVLVTNGEIEEETRVAIEQFNAQPLFVGKTRPLVVWERGRLMHGFRELWAPSWPDSSAAVGMLLTNLASDGQSLPNFEKITSFLDELFLPAAKATGAAKERFALSASSIVELYISSAAKRNNHLAIIGARHLLRLKLLAEFDNPPQSVSAIIDELRDHIRASVRDLVTEAKQKECEGVFSEGAPLTDFVNYDYRYALIMSFAAILELEKYLAGDERDEATEWLLKHIQKPGRPFHLWGEAAVPQFLAMYWFLWNRSSGLDAERMLIGLLMGIIARQNSRQPEQNLPSTYIDIEAVLMRDYGRFVGTRGWDEPRDDYFRLSQFAMSLAYLAARRNLKKTLQINWAPLSKLGQTYTEVEDLIAFYEFRTERGTNVSIYPEPTKRWDDFLRDSDAALAPHFSGPLFDDPCSLLLHVILYPHRATPSVVIHLDREFIGAPFTPPLPPPSRFPSPPAAR